MATKKLEISPLNMVAYESNYIYFSAINLPVMDALNLSRECAWCSTIQSLYLIQNKVHNLESESRWFHSTLVKMNKYTNEKPNKT